MTAMCQGGRRRYRIDQQTGVVTRCVQASYPVWHAWVTTYGLCVSVCGVSQVLEVWALLGHLLESNQGLADALRGFVRQLAANLKDAGDKVSHS